jgi:nucleoid-associated protein YgaU
VLIAVGVTCAAELGLLVTVGAQIGRIAALSTANGHPAAAAAAVESALVVLASAVALVAWTCWCRTLIETLLALASDPAGSGDGAASRHGTSRHGTSRHRRSTAVLLVLGLSTVGVTAPAAATGWDGPHRPRLDGLQLPDLPAAAMRAAHWPAGTAACNPRPVVVAAGDSLWAIAAQRLASSATQGSVPTLRAIDRSWPRWHAANRDVIGPDPDLLHPGQRLQHPVTDTCPRRTVR